MLGEGVGQQSVAETNHAGTAYYHKIDTGQILLGCPERFPGQTFDAVTVYRSLGTFSRYCQTQTSPFKFVGPAENDEITVNGFRSFVEDPLEIGFSEQSGAFSERRWWF